MAWCCGIDHHSSEYTPRRRADLELVLAFNRQLADCPAGTAAVASWPTVASGAGVRRSRPKRTARFLS
jgi:hypothetical protein